MLLPRRSIFLAFFITLLHSVKECKRDPYRSREHGAGLAGSLSGFILVYFAWDRCLWKFLSWSCAVLSNIGLYHGNPVIINSVLFCDDKQWVAACALILHPSLFAHHCLNQSCLYSVESQQTFSPLSEKLVKTLENEMVYINGSWSDFCYQAGILNGDNFIVNCIHLNINIFFLKGLQFNLTEKGEKKYINIHKQVQCSG